MWITQEQMALLFQRDKSTISRHIRNIFDEGELEESLVVAKNATPKKYGRRKGFLQEAELELISKIHRINNAETISRECVEQDKSNNILENKVDISPAENKAL